MPGPLSKHHLIHFLLHPGVTPVSQMNQRHLQAWKSVRPSQVSFPAPGDIFSSLDGRGGPRARPRCLSPCRHSSSRATPTPALRLPWLPGLTSSPSQSHEGLASPLATMVPEASPTVHSQHWTVPPRSSAAPLDSDGWVTPEASRAPDTGQTPHHLLT